MGVGRRDVRHDGCVRDGQAVGAVDAAACVHDGPGRGVGPHGAGADRVVVGPCVAADPLAKPLAVSCGDAWPRRQFLPAGQFRDGAGASRFPDPDQAVGEPVEVAGLAEVSQIDARGGGRVGRTQPHRPAGGGLEQRHADEERPAVAVGERAAHDVLQVRRAIPGGVCAVRGRDHLEQRCRADLAGISEVEGHGGVVGQVGADAGQVRHDGNAKFTKVPGGADARPQQQRRGAVRASAHNDPARPGSRRPWPAARRPPGPARPAGR